MDFKRKLPLPIEVKSKFPLTQEMRAQKEKNDRGICAVLDGTSDKFLLVIGPCSADSKEPVLEYISRLSELREKVSDKLVLVPRVYTNKPRTLSESYRGMLLQPEPEQKPNVLQGILDMRELNVRALKDYGFSCADEILYPETYRYVSDLLSYVAVGARSVENQQHRFTASGLDIPVGMKNSVSGNIDTMLNAIRTAQDGHTFIYGGWEVESAGNNYAHAILRGGMNKKGEFNPNYGEQTLIALAEKFDSADFKNPACIVDCSHANSSKNCFKQSGVALDVLSSRRDDSSVRQLVKGLMIESYLVDGSQEVGGGIFGCSVTDACLGWEKTEQLVYKIAEYI